MTKTLFALCAVLAVAACSVTTAPSSDIITVTPREESLEIQNTSSDPVYYFVADRGVLALVDFSICNEPTKCESVAPGAAKKVPYAEMLGYSGSTEELIVYHWRLVSGGAGRYQQDSIRKIIVSLK